MKRVLIAISVLTFLMGCHREEAGTTTEEIPQFMMRCTTGDVTELTHESATFNGWVSVEGADEESLVEAAFYYSANEGTAEELQSKGVRVSAGRLPSTGGGFRAEITSLVPSTRYFYVASAICADSLAFGSVRSFTTEEAPKDLGITGESLAVTEFSAILSGFVFPKQDTGEYTWGIELSANESMADSIAVFSSEISDANSFEIGFDDLQPDTDYYYRAFVKYHENEFFYGETRSFRTSAVGGEVSTREAYSITEFRATLPGFLDFQSSAQMETDMWFLFGRDPENMDSLAVSTISPDLGFEALPDTLSYGNTYYFQACARLRYHDWYTKDLQGEVLSFETTGISPTLVTLEADDITEFKATIRGTLDPGIKETMPVVVWFLYGSSPETLDRKVDSELVDGDFHTRLHQLQYGKKYYYKACCKILDAVFEADVKSFETLDITAKVTTLPADEITEFEARVNALVSEVSNDAFQKDAWFLYAPGECTADDLLLGGKRVQSSVGPDGVVSAALSGLDYGAEYSYIACIKLYDKVFYGDVRTFATVDIDADVITGDAMSIAEYTATLTGSLADRADDRFNKGIYFFYSPSASDVHSLKNLGIKVRADYLGNGQYEAQVQNLVPGLEYHYVAYFRVFDAEFFGEVKTFTSKAVQATVSATGAVDVSYHKATLAGVVDSVSNLALETTVWFMWASDPNAVDSGTRVSSSLSGSSFTAQVSGLESGKTYYYKACVTVAGFEFRSPVASFTTRTPPAGSVDLGLSVCWSSCNYGADKSSKPGTFLNWSGAVAAAVSEGMALPTYAQLDELRKNCKWIWTMQDDVPGYLVQGKNGNSIFLPETGHYTAIGTEREKYIEGDSGLWSSQPRGEDGLISFYLRYSSTTLGVSSIASSSGFPVRFVYD